MSDSVPPNAAHIVAALLAKDAFSQWLGVEVLETAPGSAKIRMTVRPEMVNGFGIAHGGIVFSFADSAFAFASNSHGRVAVAVDNSISYPAAINVGDTLTAEATEEHLTNSLGFYRVVVTRADGTTVAIFRGTVFRKRDLHPTTAS
jgi:acyl-CoA thioesterase